MIGHLLTWKAEGFVEVVRFNEHGKVCWARGPFKRKPERLSSDRLHNKSRFPVLFGVLMRLLGIFKEKIRWKA